MRGRAFFGGGGFFGPRLGQAEGVIPVGCSTMTSEAWMSASKQMGDTWVAFGKKTLNGLCAIVTYPDGQKEFLQECVFPDGTTSGMSGAPGEFENTPRCAEIWDNICRSKPPGSPGYEQCGQEAPTPPPVEMPEPLPDPDPDPLPDPIPAQLPRAPELVQLPPGVPPGRCNPEAWTRSYPIRPTLGRVRLMKGRF